MLKIPSLPDRSYIMLPRFLIASSLATMGFFFGIIPSIDFNTYQFSFASSAFADDFNEETIEKYARAALELERKRVEFYKKIAQMTDNPRFACHEPNSLNDLSPQAKDLAEQFCRESQDIVRQNGLNSKIYNEITIRRKKNPNLNRRIQEAIREI